jgi:hypothetical protein
MKVFNPTGVVRKKSVEDLLFLDELRGKTIGLVDDGWGGKWCRQFFDRIGELFTERCGVAEVVHLEKPLLSKPSPDSLLDEVVARCDAAVVGLCA